MSRDPVVAPADRVAGIVVAAGLGRRLGASVPKALERLGDRALVAHAVGGLLAAGVSRPIVVAAPAGHEDGVRRALADLVGADVDVITGGTTRQRSVAAALRRLPSACRWVLVHDAARALAPAELATAVIEALRSGAEAVIPGLPVVDTIKSVDDGQVSGTVSRDRLVAVQTPQGFAVAVLRAAHDRAAAGGSDTATDDAGLVEALGVPVRVVPGSAAALKITLPLDLRVAELLLTGAAPGAWR